MLDATAMVAAVAGYSAMSVEDVISAAGVSRRTFYDNFEDKSAVFLAAFSLIAGELTDRVLATDRPEERLEVRAELALTQIALHLRDRPDYADLLLVQSAGASETVIQARNALLERATATVRRAVREDDEHADPVDLAAELVVGGIVEVFHSRVLRGEYAELPALVPRLLLSTLPVYIGRERANAAFSR